MIDLIIAFLCGMLFATVIQIVLFGAECKSIINDAKEAQREARLLLEKIRNS